MALINGRGPLSVREIDKSVQNSQEPNVTDEQRRNGFLLPETVFRRVRVFQAYASKIFSIGMRVNFNAAKQIRSQPSKMPGKIRRISDFGKVRRQSDAHISQSKFPVCGRSSQAMAPRFAPSQIRRGRGNKTSKSVPPV